MKTDYFEGKRVIVMRIGLLGRGIGDTAYLVEAGAQVTVVDAASQAVMQSAVDQLSQYKEIVWKFGPYNFADFSDADLVLVGAGTPLDELVLVECRKAGIKLAQSAALFAELANIPIIGVTGTRGKSTVTHMIHHVLSVTTEGSVLLGGNVRGVSNLQLLKEVTPDSLCVMELDSWQLQGFGWTGISPQVSVFTSFMPDHLNYYQSGGRDYKEAMVQYFTDKAQIFLYQDQGGTLVTTPAVFAWVKQVFGDAKLDQELVLADASVIPDEAVLVMPGEHNRLNAALAFEALRAVGLSEDEILTGLASFPGVPGRLEYLGSLDGVRVYNDNNATTPEATRVGVEAVLPLGPTILIAGGADKALSLETLVESIGKTKRTILLPGTGTDRLVNELPEALRSRVEVVGSLVPAVASALAAATAGDVVLFSPGFASFGLFINEYDRNDQFVALVKEAIEQADSFE